MAMTPDRIGFYYLIENEDGKITYRPDYGGMAEYCFEKKLMGFDDAISLRFDGKKWEWLTKNSLNNFVTKENLEHIQPAHIDNFVKMIKSRCHIDDITTKSSDGFINVNNGIIDVKTGQLIPHSYEFLFKYCSPVDFDSSALAPRWDKFLEDTFAGNKELIDIAQRIFGYLLIGGRPFLHKAFVLYGTGRNGKSTFLDVLRAVLGSESYSTVSMSKLDKEFSVVAIDGKLANIVEETPNDTINAEAFKNLVGGGEIQASHKGFDEYKYRCNARFIFACNEMPVFHDKSVGLEERLVFIPFARYLKEEDRDETIYEKLMAEMPGIFNWALKGAQIMLQERKLPSYVATAAVKEQYRMKTEPLYEWFIDEIIIDPTAPNIAVKEVYDAYYHDTEDNGNKPLGKNKFSARIREIMRQKCEVLKIPYEPKERDSTGNKRIFNMMRLVRNRPKYASEIVPEHIVVSVGKPNDFN